MERREEEEEGDAQQPQQQRQPQKRRGDGRHSMGSSSSSNEQNPATLSLRCIDAAGRRSVRRNLQGPITERKRCSLPLIPHHNWNWQNQKSETSRLTTGLT
jgi:hypothetical protein